jgi:hypothetical protein
MQKVFIFLNPYNESLAQNRKFKGKGKHETRPITQQQGNRWKYKYFRYHTHYERNVNMTAISNLDLCVGDSSAPEAPVCITLPNLRKVTWLLQNYNGIYI